MKTGILLMPVITCVTSQLIDNLSNQDLEMAAIDQLKRDMCHYNQDNQIICTGPSSKVDFKFIIDLDV